MKIYKDQFFRILIDTNIDLTEATDLLIKYIDPMGLRGEWTATIDTDTTMMYYDCPGLSVTGRWKGWGKATFVEGSVPGDVAYFEVLNEGE
jgi:hypothetical protein